MKLKITLIHGDVELTCENAKLADGFLQIIKPQEKDGNVKHQELLIATSQIRIIAVN